VHVAIQRLLIDLGRTNTYIHTYMYSCCSPSWENTAIDSINVITEEGGDTCRPIRPLANVDYDDTGRGLLKSISVVASSMDR
jgi:hypothetical protein